MKYTDAAAVVTAINCFSFLYFALRHRERKGN